MFRLSGLRIDERVFLGDQMARPKPCSECGAELSDRSAPCPLCGFEAAVDNDSTTTPQKTPAPPADTDRYQRDLRRLRAELQRLRREAS